jgi:peptidoglycan hydrolase-like protein with peptidoglycan-binding domain
MGISASRKKVMNTREIQYRLKELGYEPGPIDGIFGRRTTSAVKAFQHEAGLLSFGIVGAKTLAALALDEAPRAYTGRAKPKTKFKQPEDGS